MAKTSGGIATMRREAAGIEARAKAAQSFFRSRDQYGTSALSGSLLEWMSSADANRYTRLNQDIDILSSRRRSGAASRVAVKRELRRRGVSFNTNDTLAQLKRKLR